MTVVEAIQWASRKLKEDMETPESADSPILDAEVILAATMRVTRGWLFTHFDATMRADEEERYFQSIQRRLRREPVAYILGMKSFYKRDFSVNCFVLIPRPATETLVEAALRTSETSDPEKTLFADIGTGSGAIAVTLAAESGLPVIANDVSRHALIIAKQNAAAHNIDDRVEFRLGPLSEPLVSLFQKIKETHPPPFHHLIICANLPYLQENQWKSGQPELRFEPKNALVSGKDGLDAYWELFRSLSRNRSVLPFRVSVLIEIDHQQAEQARKIILHNFPRASAAVVKDMNGLNRVIITEI